MKSKPVTTTRKNKGNLFRWTLVCAAFIFQGTYFAKGLFVLLILLLIGLLLKKKLSVSLCALFLSDIAVLAAISGLFCSLDGYTAVVEFSKYLVFPLSYLLFVEDDDVEKYESVFLAVIILTILIGLLGFTPLKGLSGMVTEKGHRLQSVFQYANEMALFAGVAVFLLIDTFICQKKTIYLIACALPLAALLLTRSRTTFVFFALVLIAYVFSLLSNKMRWVFAAGWLVFIVGVLLFGSRLARLSLTEPTFIERIISYKDGFKMAFSGFFGLGLGNWQFLSFMRQSAPYQVRYIHNGYLQICLDCGIAALILFVGAVIYMLIRSRKNITVWHYILTFLLLHLFFDVDLNFGAFILFFSYTLTRINYQDKILFSLSENKVRKRTFEIVCAAVIMANSVLFLSELYVKRGDQLQRQNYKEAIDCYKTAGVLAPMNEPTILFKIAQVERDPNTAIACLEKSLTLNPYQPSVLLSTAQGYRYMGDYVKALSYAEKLLDTVPYSRKNQAFFRDLMKEAKDTGALDEQLYEQQFAAFEKEVKEKDDSIDPLYRYIDENMDYPDY